MERLCLVCIVFTMFAFADYQVQYYPVGTGADGIIIADLDNDSQPEVIVANRVSKDLYIFKTKNTHQLKLHTKISTQKPPAIIEVADINKDNLPDIVVAHYDDYNGTARSNTFEVHYQSPDHNFSAKSYQLPQGVSSRAIAVGDINSDNELEIIVANEYRGKVYVWQWHEKKLQMIAEYPGVPTYTVSITVGDVNNDGNNDLVLYGTQLFVFLQSSQRLTSPINYGNTGGETGKIGDINNDGRNDVVGATAFSGAIDIWLQDPQNKLQRTARKKCGKYTEDVEIIDLNDDGLLDILVAERDKSQLLIFQQTPSGSLASPRIYQALEKTWLNELAVGDLNNDGIPDIAGSLWGKNDVKNPPPTKIAVWWSNAE